MRDEGPLAAFFAAYADAFTRMEPSAVTSLWLFPALVSAAGRSAAFDHPDHFEANTAILMGFYARQGVVRVEKVLLGAMGPSADTAFAVTHDRLFDRNGAIVAEWRHGYLVRLVDMGWRAIGAVADGELEAWRDRGTPLES